MGNFKKILWKFRENLENFEKFKWKLVYGTLYKFREKFVEMLQNF